MAKLARITGIPKDRRLWRGLGGMVLPDQFWRGFPECYPTLRIVLTDSAKRHHGDAVLRDARRAVRERFIARQEMKLYKGLEEEVLCVPPYREVAKVVSAAAILDEGLITLAHPKSKFDFESGGDADLWRSVLKWAVDIAGVGDKVMVALEDVSDKPEDFRGGGAWARVLSC